MDNQKKAGFLVLLISLVLAFAGCTGTNDKKVDLPDADSYSSEDITADNVTAITDILKSAGLSNADVFEDWVTDTSNNNENTGESGFSDADCRMTVMLLAGDAISYDSVNDRYDGDYLMFDIDTIENKEEYSMLRDKEKLFTTMFGETPYSGGGFADALPDNWKKHGIVFNNDKCSIISIVFKTYDNDEAYVGHTGILINCQDIADADAKYVFIEKIAFGDPFKVTKLNEKSDLIEMLSERSDYAVEEGEPAPAVYENDQLIGELKR